jgi:hypothetical protein
MKIILDVLLRSLQLFCNMLVKRAVSKMVCNLPLQLDLQIVWSGSSYIAQEVPGLLPSACIHIGVISNLPDLLVIDSAYKLVTKASELGFFRCLVNASAPMHAISIIFFGLTFGLLSFLGLLCSTMPFSARLPDIVV